MPAAFIHIFLDLLPILREVLLHPGILDSTLKVEDVVRISFQKEEVALDGLGDILIDRALNIPVPLRIKMRIRNHIDRRLLLGGCHSHDSHAHD